MAELPANAEHRPFICNIDMKKINFIPKINLAVLSVIIIVLLPLISLAQLLDSNANSYIFFLYYDNGQLFADRDYEIKYDVSMDNFIPETITTQFPFRGEVVNLLNKVASSFQFDPKRGNIKFVKGKITVKAPYAADGQKVNFYDSQGKQLVSIFVSQSSFCNDDNICNSDTGEDNTSCPNDCKVLQTPSSVVAPADETFAGRSGPPGMAAILIYSFIGGGIAFGGYFIYNWWKKKKSAGMIIPPSQLPGNPVG